MAVTVDQVRAITGSTLSDEDLQVIIDANTAAVDALWPLTPQTKTYFMPGQESLILLPRAPQITDSPLTPTVIEMWGTPDEITLSDDDYFVEGATLRRLDFGTNPMITFRGPVRVSLTYPDSAERDLAIIHLCEADITFHPGMTAFEIGKHREEFATAQQGSDYASSRDAILSTILAPGPLFD